MPCYCWYDPPEESKKLIKNLCIQIIEEIERLEKMGDPLGISLESTITLLKHLKYPDQCEEKLKPSKIL